LPCPANSEQDSRPVGGGEGEHHPCLEIEFKNGVDAISKIIAQVNKLRTKDQQKPEEHQQQRKVCDGGRSLWVYISTRSLVNKYDTVGIINASNVTRLPMYTSRRIMLAATNPLAPPACDAISGSMRSGRANKATVPTANIARNNTNTIPNETFSPTLQFAEPFNGDTTGTRTAE
jgi:hypothetical protein